MRQILVLAFVVILGSTLSAQAPPLPDVERFGPQVGQAVPDFALVDQQGDTRDLASLMGRNGLMLVFSRSADW